jgi:flagellar motor switch protein FliM
MSSESDILSQGEIDALLKGVDDGAVDLSAASASGVPHPYNIATHVRIVRGRMPALELVNERFVRQLRQGIHNMLRRTPEISIAPVQVHKFGEYLQTLRLPASLNLVKLNPLRGTALVAFDSRLVFALVDKFFGGMGRHDGIEGREFTPTEERVIQMLLRQVLVDLQAAWMPLLAMQPEHVGSEQKPMFINAIAPSEVVVINTFRIEPEGGGGGELHVTMPYSMLEPIRDLLDSGVQTDGAESDGRWTRQLHAHAQDLEIEVVPVLGRSTLTVEKLLSLKAGDMIPCDFEGDVTLVAEGIVAARGKYCSSRGKQAVQIRELLFNQRL